MSNNPEHDQLRQNTQMAALVNENSFELNVELRCGDGEPNEFIRIKVDGYRKIEAGLAALGMLEREGMLERFYQQTVVGDVEASEENPVFIDMDKERENGSQASGS